MIYRKIHTYLIWTALLCSLTMLGCASQGTVTSAAPVHSTLSGYPTDMYIIGVGSGETFEAALDLALAQISRQIEVTVSSEVNSLLSAYTSEDREIVESRYQSAVKSVTTSNLQGAEVIERSEAEGGFTVTCALDKQQFAAGLTFELDRRRTAILRLEEQAAAQSERGEVLGAIAVIDNLIAECAEFETRAKLWSALSGRQYDSGEVPSPPELTARSRAIAASVVLRKVSGDNQTALHRQPLREPLVVEAAYQSDAASAPVTGLKLAVFDDNGERAAAGTTDSKGRAEFRAAALAAPQGEYRVRVEPQGDLVTARTLTGREVVFHYEAAIRPVTLSIMVTDESGQRLSAVELAVRRAVETIGAQIDERPQVRLVGKTRTVERKTLDGPAGRRFLVRTTLDVSMVLNDGNEIGHITVTADGLDAESETKALEKAHRNLSLPRRELSAIIARVPAP